jgi:hypothetical protein
MGTTGVASPTSRYTSPKTLSKVPAAAATTARRVTTGAGTDRAYSSRPTPPAPVTPLERAATRLKACDEEHSLYYAELRAFKKAHMKVVNGVLVFLVSDLKSRSALDAELMRLVRRTTRAWRAHQSAMREYAQIKTGRPL